MTTNASPAIGKLPPVSPIIVGTRTASGRQFVAETPVGYDAMMKTTVEIEPELYSAAEQLARLQDKSIAQVISSLLRRSLAMGNGAEAAIVDLERRNGFLDVFPDRDGPPVTIESVQQLCREEGI
jgi:hypothetical protein